MKGKARTLFPQEIKGKQMPAFVQKNGIQKRKRAQGSLANKKKEEKQKTGQGGGKAQKQGADGKITPFGFLL